MIIDGRTVCDCGDEQTIEHMLVCPNLPEPLCTREDMGVQSPDLDGGLVIER